jgi:membrane protein YdbS with pleckstrin-like domain
MGKRRYFVIWLGMLAAAQATFWAKRAGASPATMVSVATAVMVIVVALLAVMAGWLFADWRAGARPSKDGPQADYHDPPDTL